MRSSGFPVYFEILHHSVAPPPLLLHVWHGVSGHHCVRPQGRLANREKELGSQGSRVLRTGYVVHPGCSPAGDHFIGYSLYRATPCHGVRCCADIVLYSRVVADGSVFGRGWYMFAWVCTPMNPGTLCPTCKCGESGCYRSKMGASVRNGRCRCLLCFLGGTAVSSRRSSRRTRRSSALPTRPSWPMVTL